MKLETSRVFDKNIGAINEGFRYIINQGSTRSTKSYSAMQINVLRRITHPNTRGIVAGITLDIVKSTSLRDVRLIMGDLYDKIGVFYKSEMTYFFNNGSEIKFISADKPEKFHGIGSDDVFLEEPNIWKEPDELIKQLSMRCNGFLMLTLNPSRKLDWLNTIEARGDSSLIHSTYRDNPFLSERIINEIKERSKTDEVYKAIYSDGVYVANTELSVFKNWTLTDEMPRKEDCKWTIFGLDFGWSNDETALVELRLYNGALYLKEHIYKTGLRTKDLAKLLIPIDGKIICDNSDGRLKTELREAGVRDITKTRKPKGMKLINIRQLQNIPIFIHSKSVNLRTEFELYQFKKVNGDVTSVVNEKRDHLIDAMIYGWRKKVRD